MSCVPDWCPGLIPSVKRSSWYLDWCRQACGRGVRGRPAALQASTARLPCMSAVCAACRSGLWASSRPSRRVAGTSTGATGPAAGGSGVGPRPCRRVLHVSRACRQCAWHARVVCRPHLVRHDVRLSPRLGPPGLRPGGPGSSRGPAGEYCTSPVHVSSALGMPEWFVGLISSVTTCGWYLDWGRRACGRGVRGRPAALQASTARLPCMSAVRLACRSGLWASSRPSRRAAGTSTEAAGHAAGGSGLGPRPCRRVLHVSRACRQCA